MHTLLCILYMGMASTITLHSLKFKCKFSNTELKYTSKDISRFYNIRKHNLLVICNTLYPCQEYIGNFSDTTELPPQVYKFQTELAKH